VPKLLVFAPCEKVIISQDENNPTLIAILSDIAGEFVVADDERQPSDAVGPMRWSLYTQWSRQSGDENKDYQQAVRLISPSGKQVLNAVTAFKMEQPNHRIVNTVNTVPVSESGLWTLEVYLKDKETADWPSSPLATYPLGIHFVMKRMSETTVKERADR
jgi:hypothetical protein